MENKNPKVQVKAKPKAKPKANSKAKPKPKPKPKTKSNLKQKMKSVNKLLKKQRGGSYTINLFMTKYSMNWTGKLEKILNILFESLKDNNKYQEKLDELEDLGDEYHNKARIIDKSDVFFILNYSRKPTPLTLLRDDPAILRVDYVDDKEDLPNFRIVEKYEILLDRNRELIEEYYKIKENLRDIQKEITVIEKEIIKKIKNKEIMLPKWTGKITEDKSKKELINLLNRMNLELRKLEEWKEYLEHLNKNLNKKNENNYDSTKDSSRKITVISDEGKNIKNIINEKLDMLNTKKELYELLLSRD